MPPKPPKPMPADAITRLCAHCAKPFLVAPRAGRRKQLYCSHSCRTIASYKRCYQPSDGKRGRPSLYTAELAESVIAWLSAGLTLRSWARCPGRPDRTTVINWARANIDGFGDRLRTVKWPASQAQLSAWRLHLPVGQKGSGRPGEGQPLATFRYDRG
jgi:hypothetical protein